MKYTKHDFIHRIYVHERNLGNGKTSFLKIIIEASIRELGILLNSDDEDGLTSRARILACSQNDKEPHKHPKFIIKAMKLLAQHGLLLRSHKYFK